MTDPRSDAPSESQERKLLREWQALYREMLAKFIPGGARLVNGGLAARTDALLAAPVSAKQPSVADGGTAKVPEGMVLVPKEYPRDLAAQQQGSDHPEDIDACRHGWQEMLQRLAASTSQEQPK